MAKNTLIDFHAHILPGMDHGCESIAMSMDQLRMATEHKFEMVIATSHFYPHMESVESFLRRREDAWSRLAAAKKREYPVIKLGAEVLICNNIDKMAGIEALCLENTKVLLIEMPFMRHWEPNLVETVVRLREEKGLEVILAHGERYPAKEVEKLLVKGFQLQLNVTSLVNIITPHFITKWIVGDYVSAFGSDIHGLHNSYKKFTKAMIKWGVHAEKIMEKTHELLGEDKGELMKSIT